MPTPHKFSVNKKGFTLVELLIVISIIAILSVIGMVIYGSVQKGARDSRRKSDLHSIQNALELYRQANTSYPDTEAWVHSTSSGSWIPGLSSYFASGTVPVDPLNNGYFFNGVSGTDYGYSYYNNTVYGGTAGSWYMLTTALEKPTAADLATKCTTPNGTVFNYGTQYQQNAYMVCNQQ